MSMTMLEIILVIVALIEIFGFVIALFLLNESLKVIKFERGKFNEDVLQKLMSFMNEVKQRDEKQTEIIMNMNAITETAARTFDTMKEQYDDMYKQYSHIDNGFQNISDHYRKLLEAWKNVEERYSDCYEQLAEMNKKLDFMAEHYWNPDDDCEVLDSQFLDIPAKDCKYNYCGECQNEDCPALNLYCTVIDPIDCKYSDISGYPDGLDEDENVT